MLRLIIFAVKTLLHGLEFVREPALGSSPRQIEFLRLDSHLFAIGSYGAVPSQAQFELANGTSSNNNQANHNVLDCEQDHRVTHVIASFRIAHKLSEAQKAVAHHQDGKVVVNLQFVFKGRWQRSDLAQNHHDGKGWKDEAVNLHQGVPDQEDDRQSEDDSPQEKEEAPKYGRGLPVLQINHVVDGSEALLEFLAPEASEVGPNVDNEKDGENEKLDCDQKANQIVEHVVTCCPLVETLEVDKYSQKQVKVGLLYEHDLPAPKQGLLYLGRDRFCQLRPFRAEFEWSKQQEQEHVQAEDDKHGAHIHDCVLRLVPKALEF